MIFPFKFLFFSFSSSGSSNNSGNIVSNALVHTERYEQVYVNTSKEQRNNNNTTNITTSIYYDNNFNSTLMDADITYSNNFGNNQINLKPECASISDNCTNNNFKEMNILVKISQREELEIFEKFCENSFSNDTIFALCVIQQNSSNIIVSEIIEYLWLQFKSCNFIVSCAEGDFILKKLVVLDDEVGKKGDLVRRHVKKRSSSGTRGDYVLSLNESGKTNRSGDSSSQRDKKSGKRK
jgi:hypothetical protein